MVLTLIPVVAMTTYLSSLKQEADALNTVVISSEKSQACKEGQSRCVLIASSKRVGINMHYTKKAPDRLGFDVLWYGGFIDPSTGVVYDFLGRVYQSQESQLSMQAVQF